jgi:hypothetical protein
MGIGAKPDAHVDLQRGVLTDSGAIAAGMRPGAVPSYPGVMTTFPRAWPSSR